MASRRLSVCVPEPLLDALYAEGSRTYESPGQVAARVLCESLPGYVEHRLRRDLAPVIRSRVIETRSAPALDHVALADSPHAEVAPALAEATPNQEVPQPQVLPTISGDLNDEDSSRGSSG